MQIDQLDESVWQPDAGPGDGSSVPGPDGKWAGRAYLELFRRQEAQARLAQEVRDRRWTRGIAIAAVIISVLALIISARAWLFPGAGW